MISPSLSLDTIITAIACLCSTTNVREEQVSTLLNVNNISAPYAGFWKQTNQIEDISNRLSKLESKLEQIHGLLERSLYGSITDCSSVAIAKDSDQGINYELQGLLPFIAVCTNVDSNGNWLVVQRRRSGVTDFYRNWNEYRNGFGDIASEFFMGLERLHIITKSRPHELLIRMRKAGDNQIYEAHYDLFEIGDIFDGYNLKKLGNYRGTAGDSLRGHLGVKFSTFDRDNDFEATKNCALAYHGAWWFTKCFTCHLNGQYFSIGKGPSAAFGIIWYDLTDYDNSLLSVDMLIRPVK